MEKSDHLKLDRNSRVYDILLDKIRRDPSQPRKHFNEEKLQELADSIKDEGLHEPIEVKAIGDGTFLVVFGERRFRACEMLGLSTIKSILTDKTDAQIADARLAENLMREDLDDLELGREFQRRVDLGQTHEQIAQKIHKKRAFISQRIALLRLPEEVKTQLEKKEISFTQARSLMGSDGDSVAPNSDSVVPENSAVTSVILESLETYGLFKRFFAPNDSVKLTVDLLTSAMTKDLAKLRRVRYGKTYQS
jgi:ParB family chromosome partitioning protein